MLYVLPLHALLLANYPTAAHSAAYGALSQQLAPNKVQMQGNAPYVPCKAHDSPAAPEQLR